MSGFDTTGVAAQVTPPGNPLGIVEGFANLQNSLNQNKMFQAKALAGQMLEQSTGPDGQPDLGKFSAALQSDPRTAPFAQEALQGVAALRGAGLANQAAALGVANTQRDTLKNISATYGVTNPKDVSGAIARAVQSGSIDPEVASSYMGNGAMSADIRAAIIGGSGGPGAQTALTGTPTQTSAGGHVVTNLVNPYAGTSTPMTGSGADIPITMTPAEKLARNSGIDPDTGQPFSAPNASTATPTGDVRPNNGITGPHGEITTGLPTGGEVQKLGYAQQLQTLQSQKDLIPQQESNVKELMALAKQVRTGPGATQSADVITAINRLTGANFDPVATPAQQVLNKLSETVAATNRPILGLLPTNEQINLSRAASPNTNISPEAIQELGANALGNLEYTKAKNAAWDWTDAQQFQKTGKHLNPGTDYATVQSRFNARHDPRYFQQEYWTPQQRQQQLDAMSVPERARYLAGKTQSDALVKIYGNGGQ